MYYPYSKSRQYSEVSDGRFDSGSVACRLSPLFSLEWHSRGLMLRCSSPSLSTFLRPFAPWELPRFIAIMDALTPVGSALWFLTPEHELHPIHPAGLPGSCTLPSSHSVSNHPMTPHYRFYTLPLSLMGFRIFFSTPVWASPFPNRLAVSYSRIEFTYVTD